MRNRNRAARVGRFDVLEDRIVMSRASIVVNDVTAFYSNYAATVPAMVANWQVLKNTADMTGTAADLQAAQASALGIRTAIVGDVNGLATQLFHDLGRAGFNSIRLSVTGVSAPTSAVTSDSNQPNPGSLLYSLLAIGSADLSALGGVSGVQLAANLSVTTSYAVSIGTPILPLTPFGNFTATWFSDVQPLAHQLDTDRAAGGTTPSMQQLAAIETDIQAIDAVTIRDTNVLATTLVAQLGKGSTQGIGTIITGVNSTTSPLFTPGGTAPAFGSLLATLLLLDTNTALLESPFVAIGIVTQTAFI
ncbi:MAG TPA: hypothetical protein VGH33_21185 [Isosphaeraceae bacterium]|jgi:hypothetical protein